MSLKLVGASIAAALVAAALVFPVAEKPKNKVRRVAAPDGLGIPNMTVGNRSVRRATPQAFLRGPTLILGPHGRFMFGGAVEYDKARADLGQPKTSPAARVSPDLGREQYVMWGFSARRDAFAMPAELEALDAEDLKSRVLALMTGWAPELRHLVQAAEPSTVTAFPVKTSIPIPVWRTRNVTLLGDALHNMTPFRGIGANTALRDAAALRRALSAVDQGEDDLISALAAYEREMVDYGFRAVRDSLRNMERFHAQQILTRAVTRAFFRIIDAMPPVVLEPVKYP